MKKVLSFILVLSMVLGSFGMTFAASASDIAGHQNETAILRLNKLGIVTGYENGDFKPDANITRAEFAVLLVRALGLEGAASARKGDTQFTDVTVAAGYEWASGAINVATSLGHIQGYGNGKFGPADQITYQDAITLVVRALGYEAKAKELGGYPTGHFIVADRDLELTEDIKNAALGVAATRGTVFQLLDNALTVDMMEQVWVGDTQRWQVVDKTLLTVLGYEKVEGRVVEVDAKDKEIVLRDETSKKTSEWKNLDALTVEEGIDFEAVLGLKITAWYDAKEESVISWETKDKALFDAFEYESEDEEITLVVGKADYELHEEAVIYINGKASRVRDLEEKYNYAKVVIKDGDAIFVNVYNWDDYLVVEKVEKNEIFAYGDDLEVKDYTIVKDGATISVEDIEKGDILFFNKKAEYAEVFNKYVEGVVKRVYTDRFEVDGKDYKFANETLSSGAYYLNEKEDLIAMDQEAAEQYKEEGKAVRAFLDRNNKLVFVTGDLGVAPTTSFYGYVINDTNTDANGYNMRNKNYRNLDVVNEEAKKAEYDILIDDIDDDLYVNGVDSDWTTDIKKGAIVKITVDEDGDVEEVELVNEVTIASSKLPVKVSDKFVDKYKLSANTVLFDITAKPTNPAAKDIETIKLGDVEDFDKIITAEFYTNDKDEVVVIIVKESDKDSEVKTVNAVATGAAVKVKGEDTWRLPLVINGEKANYFTRKDAINSTKAALVTKGAYLVVEFDVENKEVRDVTAIVAGDNLVVSGVVERVSNTDKSLKLVANTKEYQLNADGKIFDHTDSYAELRFRDLKVGDTVDIVVVSDSSRYAEYIILKAAGDTTGVTGDVVTYIIDGYTAQFGRLTLEDVNGKTATFVVDNFTKVFFDTNEVTKAEMKAWLADQTATDLAGLTVKVNEKANTLVVEGSTGFADVTEIRDQAANAADVAAVKTLIEGAAYVADQVDAATIADAKSEVEAVIAGLNLNGVGTTVVDGIFTAATAGVGAGDLGTNGSYTFTVQLTKGTAGTLATATTVTVTMTIIATPGA